MSTLHGAPGYTPRPAAPFSAEDCLCKTMCAKNPRRDHRWAISADAGIKFHLLGNEVVTHHGINGAIPPCCITSLWKNGGNGRTCVDLDHTRAIRPRETDVATMPDHGHPGMVVVYEPETSRDVTSPDTPVATKATRRPRTTPPRDITQSSPMPEIPPILSPPGNTRNSLYPTPSQLSLPEPERHASMTSSPQLDPPRCPILSRRPDIADVTLTPIAAAV